MGPFGIAVALLVILPSRLCVSFSVFWFEWEVSTVVIHKVNITKLLYDESFKTIFRRKPKSKVNNFINIYSRVSRLF